MSLAQLLTVPRRVVPRVAALSRPSGRAASTVAQLLARDPATLDESPITVTGWLRNVRHQKRLSFMELNDGSVVDGLQVVSGPLEGAAKPGLGAAVSITGKLVKSPKPSQPLELQATDVKIVGACPETYPLQPKAHTPEFLRDMMHLRPRIRQTGAMLRVRHTLMQSIHRFFDGRDFTHIHTPIITSNDCEGAGELFSVASASAPPAPPSPAAPASAGAASSAATAAAAAAAPPSFFGKPAYLTVSGQLHLEAFACALSRVYTFGPTFRAENSNTSRHLAEFWMLEPEVAPGSMTDAMDLAEGCIKRAVGDVLSARAGEVAFFTAKQDAQLAERLATAADTGKPFARMTYTRAVEVLQASGEPFKVPVVWGEGLASEHERWLAERHVQGPVFVTDYPAAIKPFYMKRNAADAGSDRATVQAFDLLVPSIGELVGGSAREDDFDVLASAMSKARVLSPAMTAALAKGTPLADIPPADLDAPFLDWYLDLRRYGSMPHAGWGMGFERLVLFSTGIENIRDAIPVPRVPNSCRM